jgi:hypothetical protein
MGFSENEVDTVRISKERGLCPKFESLNVEGENPASHQFKFKRPKGTKTTLGLVRALPKFLKRNLVKKVPHPFIIKEKTGKRN